MKVIYENKVKALGECVDEFKDANMFVLFGDNAPEEITDYCYHVDVTPLNGEIAAGQTLILDGVSYKITAVGAEAPVTLAGLGHCSVSFSGQQVERGKPEPDIFLLAAREVGCSPEECYVFEDSVNGVRAGMAAGCVTVMIPDLVPPPEGLTVSAVCESLSDVKALMEDGSL